MRFLLLTLALYQKIRKKDQLTLEQIQRLDDLGFAWTVKKRDKKGS